MNFYRKNLGFTLIELLIVIALIAVFAAIVLAALGSARGKGSDAKVQAQLKSMVNQAQLFTGDQSGVAATTTAPTGTAGGNMFNDSTTANNSLYTLINSLPTGTAVYYGKSNSTASAGGAWAFAASTSKGSFCVDATGVAKLQTTTIMTAGNAATLYPNLASGYSCN